MVPELRFLSDHLIATRLAQMKVREVISTITADGWYLARTSGSHRIYKHAAKAGRVVVAGKSSDDVPIGTLITILKQAGLR
ncbi:MAG TPA: type II toxin-antitoxin system HicA family toxin [Longimicrobium sp.]|nr:type II toxin-antitoxin system HicA family toxin [Longimicrobium sp.]